MVEAAGPNPPPMEVRLLAVCMVVTFAGFMCCDELIRLDNAGGMHGDRVVSSRKG